MDINCKQYIHINFVIFYWFCKLPICVDNSEKVSEWTYVYQRGHMETGTQFKVSSEWQEKWEIDLTIPGLVV